MTRAMLRVEPLDRRVLLSVVSPPDGTIAPSDPGLHADHEPLDHDHDHDHDHDAGGVPLDELIAADLAAKRITDEQAKWLHSDLIRNRLLTAQLPAGVTALDIYNSFSSDIQRAKSDASFVGPRATRNAPAEVTIAESEPNNTTATANALPLGIGAGKDPSVDVSGSLSSGDVDYFSFTLNAGDVIGAALSTSGRLSLRDSAGVELMGSAQNATSILPTSSPLPKVGSVVLHWVIDTTGTYYLAASNGAASYTANLRVFRPTLEAEDAGTPQTLFIDFDGGTVDASLFGGSGMRTLSPLSSFLAGWGLTAADESNLITSIMATIEENLSQDMRVLGTNGNYDATNNPGDFDIVLLNSRDHADPFGQPNVSRVFVGGTTAELGISTIGIAEDIDPGNFSTASSAVTLLDLLSAVSTNANSLNQYALAPGRTRLEVVGLGVGNVTAHEAGHFFGAWHTSNANAMRNVQDQGGNLDNTTGIGADRTFGTADDVDVDFGDDAFASSEGFTGTEDTLNLIAHGLPTGTIDPTTGDVRGTIFSDLNANGTRDAGEGPLAGVVVYVDADNDSVLDSGEQFVTSAANGTYELANLAPATYVIRQVAPTGYTLIAPASGFHSAVVTIGGAVENLDFANQPLPASISGTVWDDLNGNGTQDSGESGRPGVTVYLDTNNDGSASAGEPTDVTDAAGVYDFGGLAPGTYLVRLVVPVGFAQTFPVGATGKVEPDDFAAGTDISTAVSGVTLSATGVSPTTVFANTPAGGFASTGTRGFTSTGQTYWLGTRGLRAAFAAGTNTASLDFITDDSSENNAELRAFDTMGNVIDSELIAGPITGTGTITTLTVDAPSGQSIAYVEANWDRVAGSQTGNLDNLRYGSIGAASLIYTLVPGQSITNAKFGVREIVPGSISGVTWNDQDGDGTRDAGEPTLPGWTVFLDVDNDGVLDSGEVSAVTDSAGAYSFNVNPGTYVVSQVLQSSWLQTSPAAPGRYTVQVAIAQAVQNRDFGNREIIPGRIAGTKWSDADGDGTFDAGESPLSGVTIYLDLDGDRTLDAGEPNTVTDASGNYEFAGLALGTYAVREVVPLGYQQTFPGTSSGGVYVSDFNADAVYLYDLTGARIRTFSSTGNLDGPNTGGVAVDAAGTLYVASSLNDYVVRFNAATGAYLGRFAVGGFPVGITFGPDGLLYVAQQSAATVSRYNAATGALVGAIATLSGVRGLEWGGDGNLYLSAATAVHRYNMTTAQLTRFSTGASMTNADGLAFGADGNLYVSDTSQAFVTRFNASTGAFVSSLPYTRVGSGAEGIDFGPDGLLYVANTGTVQRYNPADNAFAGDFVTGLTAATSVYFTALDSHVVTIASGTDAIGRNFGNQQVLPGTISGITWSDLDQDGTRDAGEPVSPGWTIFLDADADGTLDAGEVSVLSDASGAYSFTVNPGSYVVAQVPRAGWTQTFPALPGRHSVLVGNGQAVVDRNFGNHFIIPGSISGTKWSDADGDGSFDAGESPLAGVTIYIDLDNDRTLDAGEPSTVTGADGRYEFTAVAPGSYTVREVVPAGYRQTFPRGSSGELFVTEFSSNRARKLALNGTSLQTYVDAALVGPDMDSVTFAPDGTVYVSGFSNSGRIVRFNPATGAALGSFATQAGAVGLEFGRDGNLWVVNYSAGTVARYNPTTGALVSTVATGLSEPLEIELGPDGNMYVNVRGAGTIRRYDSLTGTLVDVFISSVSSPQAMAFGPDRALYVISGSTVRRYNGTTGVFDRIFTSGGPSSTLYSMDFAPDGDLYISTATQLLRFNGTTGVYVNTPITGLSNAFAVRFNGGDAHFVNIASGGSAPGLDFGNLQLLPGSIGGTIWSDLDRDAVRDAGEPGLPGFTVYIDADADNLLDAGERTSITDAAGAYLFDNVFEGNYRIAFVQQAGYQQMFPLGNVWNVTLGNGQAIADRNFGNHLIIPGSISGTKWNDLDGDAVRDAGELPLAGVTIYLDQNNNATLDAGEPSRVTDANGDYQFTGLTIGNYVVREVAPAGYEQTFPVPSTDPAHRIILQSGDAIAGRNFGNTLMSPSTLGGIVYSDLDRDGIRDAGEPALAGQMLYLDSNANAALDAGEPIVFSGADGSYVFTVARGTHRVAVVRFPNQVQTAPASSAPWSVTVPWGATRSDLNFGVHVVLPAAISGTVWRDDNRNGARDAGEAGLPNWIVFLDADSDGRLDAGENVALSGVDGSYAFANLAPGTYTVAQILQSGYERTFPAAGAMYSVTLVSGQTVTARDFGIHQIVPGSVSGKVWNDRDADGVVDAGESPLADVVVYLDLDLDAVLDANEPRRSTGVDGSYEFTAVTPGQYVVRQVIPAGYQQVFPITALPRVALFDNASFVDTNNTFDSESDNLQAVLALRSIPYTTFTGITATALTAALANATVLMIPELEVASLVTALPADARQVIVNFVNGGGSLVLFGDINLRSTALINTLFSLNVTQSGSSTATFTRTAAATGTPYAAGPASVAGLSATIPLATTSLPSTARALYNSATGTTAVSTIPIGSGLISYLGWDWYDALPVGTQDGGWNTLLGIAASNSAVPGNRGYFVEVQSASVITGRDFGIREVLRVTNALFNYELGNEVVLRLDNPIAGVSASAITLVNLDSQQVLPTSSYVVSYNSSIRQIVVRPAVGTSAWPDGNYRVTLVAGSVLTPAGEPLARDATLDFFVNAGDANRSRVVDFDDLLALAGNYGTAGSFSQGDFNYDGQVNFDDLLILAAKYNLTLPAPPTPAPNLRQGDDAEPRPPVWALLTE